MRKFVKTNQRIHFTLPFIKKNNEKVTRAINNKTLAPHRLNLR